MINLIPEIELKTKKEIKIFQDKKLIDLMHYLATNSSYYKRLLSKHNILPDSIRGVNDLLNIPPTTKDDLQKFNWDFLCVSKSRIFEYTSTSGTLGKPVTIALTENDIQRLGYNEQISFACANGSAQDVYQLMLTLDRQFMAGMAYYEGIRKLGAGLVRVGPGLPAMQLETIQRIKPTALVAVPSFMLKLIEYAQQQGIDLNKSSVRKAICIGEGIRTRDFELNTLGKRIKESWNIDLFSTYASTEMQTAFTECQYGCGGHHHPELVIIELLDDENKPVGAGEEGEVTITTLGVEGMPLLRYKTGDMAIAHDEVCTCGRTTLRLSPVLGRKQQMIKLKGTTLYPSGIFDILQNVEMVHDFVVEAYTGEWQTDELRIHILTDANKQDGMAMTLRSVFQSHLRIVPEIRFVTHKEIELMQMGNQERKIRRFMDSRT